MAGEEDVELRDLVAQTLETKGVLGKIRAQLRANVFLALEEQESQQKSHPFVNDRLQQYVKTKEGQLAVGVVRDFLQFFELDFTLAVFDPETSALDTFPGREQLARDLDLGSTDQSSRPLLACLLQKASQSPTAPQQLSIPDPTPVSTSTHASVPPPVVTDAERTTSSADSFPHPSGLVTTSVGLGLATTLTSSGSSGTVNTSSVVSGGGGGGGGGREGGGGGSHSRSAHSLDGKMNGTDSGGLFLSRAPPPPSSKPPGAGEGSGVPLGGEEAYGELGESFVNNSSLDMEKLLNSSGDISELLKQGGRPGDAEQDELDDFFSSTPLPGVRDEKGKSSGFKGQQRKGGGKGSEYEDDFHSERATVSEHIEESSHPLPSFASGRLETTDVSLSQNSLAGDFDYVEQVQT